MSPSIDVLVRIARACRVSLDWLGDGTGEGPAVPDTLPATGTDPA